MPVDRPTVPKADVDCKQNILKRNSRLQDTHEKAPRHTTRADSAVKMAALVKCLLESGTEGMGALIAGSTFDDRKQSK